jgi:hypothetical protein
MSYDFQIRSDDNYSLSVDVDLVCSILSGSVIQFSRFVRDHVWHHRG